MGSFYKGFPWKKKFTRKSFVKNFRIFKLESDFFPHFLSKIRKLENSAHLFILNYNWANFQRNRRQKNSSLFHFHFHLRGGLGRFRIRYSKPFFLSLFIFSFLFFSFFFSFSFFFFPLFPCFLNISVIVLKNVGISSRDVDSNSDSNDKSVNFSFFGYFIRDNFLSIYLWGMVKNIWAA